MGQLLLPQPKYSVVTLECLCKLKVTVFIRHNVTAFNVSFTAVTVALRAGITAITVTFTALPGLKLITTWPLTSGMITSLSQYCFSTVSVGLKTVFLCYMCQCIFCQLYNFCRLKSPVAFSCTFLFSLANAISIRFKSHISGSNLTTV